MAISTVLAGGNTAEHHSERETGWFANLQILKKTRKYKQIGRPSNCRVSPTNIN